MINLSGICIYTTSYWKFEYNYEYAGRKESSLREELADLLIKSVKYRIKDESNVYLSLSNGYDSTSILGILGDKLGIPDIKCFSYAYGELADNSDAYLAQHLAKLYRYEHKIAQSYNGDIKKTVERNVLLGQGISRFSDEIDCWFNLAHELTNNSKNIMFVGDQSYGYEHSDAMGSFDDIRNLIHIFDFSGLKWIKHKMPENIYSRFAEAMDSELDKMRQRANEFKNFDDAKGFIYQDQRLCHLLLSWRDLILGNFIQVQNPHLDFDILEFNLKLPAKLRMRKYLYISTVEEMFPKIYKSSRAQTSNYIPNWSEELKIIPSEDILFSQDSILERYFPYELVKYVYEANYMDRYKILSKTKHKLNKIRFITPISNYIYNKVSVPLFQIVPSSKLLLRLYILKTFLTEIRKLKIQKINVQN